MSFADHFSKQAIDYARYRPGYPPALFDWLKTLTPQHELAWDVGTGNGQAAVGLATFFDRVVATDPSAAQIQTALAHPRITYCVQSAEQSTLADRSVDLVTIAQALHWFEFERFYAEARRVLKPHGVIAAWTYTLNEVAPDVDVVVRRFYKDIVGPYWPAERAYIDACYRTIPFPFAEIPAPQIRMQTQWTLADYLGYLRTWSATQRYAQVLRHDPILEIAALLANVWDEKTIRSVVWPMHLRVGNI